MTILLYTYLAIIGLAIGSFLNVVIYRLPLMLKQEWEENCKEILNLEASSTPAPVNLFTPRSFCSNCQQTISAINNIPLLSFLFLRGKCNNCHYQISWRYPGIELLTCLLSLFAAWYFDWNLILIFVLLFIWILIPLFFIDLKLQLLPDNLTLGLLWLGLIANTQNLFTTLPCAVYSTVGAYLFLWLIIKIFYLITGKIGMGHGDFKLFAAFGAWFGWLSLPLILIFSSILGLIIGLIYLKTVNKGKDTPIPFGPFLCIAGLFNLFWGTTIIDWYINLLG